MLPKIEHPVFKIKIPSINKDHSFRPFLVKEEKILLMAKESGVETDIFSAIKQIISNCSLDSNLNIDKLCIFDLEYIFLKLRSYSVDNIVKIAYKDEEDNEIYEFDIDLNDVKVVFPESKKEVIEVNDKVGLILKYPSASLYDDKEFLNAEENHYFELIIRCVDKIYFDEEIYEVSDISKEQLEEFIENLNVNIFKQVNEFLIHCPKLEYTITFENKNKTKREIFLNSLNDFFTWR